MSHFTNCEMHITIVILLIFLQIRLFRVILQIDAELVNVNARGKSVELI